MDVKYSFFLTYKIFLAEYLWELFYLVDLSKI
jgi:hypothetical protein